MPEPVNFPPVWLPLPSGGEGRGERVAHQTAFSQAPALTPALCPTGRGRLYCEYTNREPVTTYIALGANLGDAAHQVCQAITSLANLPDTQLVRASSLYRSAPVDANGPDYINAVAELLTFLSAPNLLKQLQKLEQAAGRERPFLNAPRTLDLDLLLYGSAQIASQHLTVPHPRMPQRAFVLLPLAEIAPQRVSAADLQNVAHQSIARMDRHETDTQEQHPVTPSP